MSDFDFDPENTAQVALVERVEYRVDQVTAQGQTVPTNQASAYQELTESTRSILRRAQRELVYPAAKDGSSELESSHERGRLLIPLPADFLRFIRLRLASWGTSVDELLPVDSSRYRLLQNQYTGADRAHPAAALAPHFGSEVKQAIECYPSDTSAHPIALLAYVPETRPENAPSDLLDGIAWEAAGRVLQAQKEQGAEEAFTASARAISGLRYGKMGEDQPAE